MIALPCRSQICNCIKSAKVVTNLLPLLRESKHVSTFGSTDLVSADKEQSSSRVARQQRGLAKHGRVVSLTRMQDTITATKDDRPRRRRCTSMLDFRGHVHTHGCTCYIRKLEEDKTRQAASQKCALLCWKILPRVGFLTYNVGLLVVAPNSTKCMPGRSAYTQSTRASPANYSDGRNKKQFSLEAIYRLEDTRKNKGKLSSLNVSRWKERKQQAEPASYVSRWRRGYVSVLRIRRKVVSLKCRGRGRLRQTVGYAIRCRSVRSTTSYVSWITRTRTCYYGQCCHEKLQGGDKTINTKNQIRKSPLKTLMSYTHKVR